MVAAWLNCPPLAAVDPAALAAAPGKAGQCMHFLFERMIDRDGEFAITIHFGHLSQKIRPMVRTSLEDVVLPLVNHFMCEGADELISATGSTAQQEFEEGERETDFALRGFVRSASTPGRAWAGPAHEHADRRCQPSAPDKWDRWERAIEMLRIEVGPDGDELFAGKGRIGA